MKREFQIPESLEAFINENLKAFGITLSSSKKIASCVQWQSDFYIQKPNQQTPWKDDRAQIAQWAYYLPLNFLRNLSVLTELKSHVPLSAFEGALDYGAGQAASSWALRQLGFQGRLSLYDRMPMDPQVAGGVRAEIIHKIEPALFKNQLAFFSYSLTEIETRHDLMIQFPFLVIIEPSTQSEGRRLSETRQLLIENDYQIMAPCTHQKRCPLITHSQRDWCHDRILFKKPIWMAQYEKNLPFRNDSLTFSYLIAFKKSLLKPEWTRSDSILKGRLTGDNLTEKGKDKQLVCFDDQRVFLTWMHKTKIEQILPRGGMVEIPDDRELVSNELRIKKEIRYLV